MSYTVELTSYAERILRKLSPDAYQKVREGLVLLSENPRPTGCKKLQG